MCIAYWALTTERAGEDTGITEIVRKRRQVRGVCLNPRVSGPTQCKPLWLQGHGTFLPPEAQTVRPRRPRGHTGPAPSPRGASAELPPLPTCRSLPWPCTGPCGPGDAMWTAVAMETGVPPRAQAPVVLARGSPGFPRRTSPFAAAGRSGGTAQAQRALSRSIQTRRVRAPTRWAGGAAPRSVYRGLCLCCELPSRTSRPPLLQGRVP